MNPATDRKGDRYGWLVVLRREGSRGRAAAWLCRCDCGQRVIVTGQDLARGRTKSCGCLVLATRKASRGDAPSYRSAHRRIYTDLGKPSDHACVHCGGPAAEWAYDHSDPDELFEVRQGRKASMKYVVPYSVNPECYVPMCVPCHRTFDVAAKAAEAQA